MSHKYPIAETSEAAINPSVTLAATVFDVKRLTGRGAVLSTEWLDSHKIGTASINELVERGIRKGFAQVYENIQGQRLFAITFWKISPIAISETSSSVSTKKVDPVNQSAQAAKSSKARTGNTAPGRIQRRGRRRKKTVDTRQLDLFNGPDQRGYEYTDGNNPSVIIPQEEGDGTTFGLAPAIPDTSALEKVRRKP